MESTPLSSVTIELAGATFKLSGRVFRIRRLFDELAMMVMSRTKGYREPEEVERKAPQLATDWPYVFCTAKPPYS